MKKLLNFAGVILTIIIVIWDIIEFLAIPALFIIVGLLNSFPWQYYAITIGGYIVLWIAAEIVAHFVFKALDKKYTPLIKRMLEKIFNKTACDQTLKEYTMTHQMKLKPEPFSQIESGNKTIELRLYDEKRQKIKVDDIIVFTHAERSDRTLRVRVTALHRFTSFQALYAALPLTKCGYTEADVVTASFKDMQQYYDPKEEQLYGVLGIEFILI